MKRSRWIAVAGAALALALATAGTATGAVKHRGGGAYTVMPLVSDQAGVAPVTDANLVNAWGVSEGPATPWWVANNGTSTSTLYDAMGTRFPPPPNGPLVVSVPGAPTGTVFYGGTKLQVSNGTTMVSPHFIFATESGTILGWPGGPAAVVAADRSKWGAVYKGLAVSGDWLYATDFANGRVDIFDGNWQLVKKPGAFGDPKLPKGYAPFGIQNLGGNIFVTFAKQQAGSTDEQAGPGFGVVDEFSPSGDLLHRVATFGKLNAPWGLAWAPSSGFGKASGALLVGNFGDGRINTFRQDHKGRWKWSGRLLTKDRKPVVIDGLWGIGFGNGAIAGPTTTLYFAAGPNDESHGLFGAITAMP